MIPLWKRGCTRDLALPVTIWGSPYGNGDVFHCNPHMETGIPIWKRGCTRDVAIPVTIWGLPVTIRGSPYGND